MMINVLKVIVQMIVQINKQVGQNCSFCLSLIARLLIFLFILAIAAIIPNAVGAEANKVLHVLLAEAETSLDPAIASDASTLSINENIFDALLRYDYLARPLVLQPNTIIAMPEISSDHLTYIFRLRHGIFFTSDEAFGTRPGELTAQDYVYSIKRLYDPTIKSPWLFLFEHKLAGDEALLPGSGSQLFDVDTPIVGIKALDRYTLQIQLQKPDNNLLFALATPATGAVAREVIQANATNPGSHPIGTGPYYLSQWERNNRIVLTANPNFHADPFVTSSKDPNDLVIATALRNKHLPIIGKIDIRIKEEQLTRVLGFLKAEFDYLEPLPAPLIDMALENGHLKPALRQRGIVLSTATPLRTFYMWMNMDDPIIGGYTPEKIALRRAIALAYSQVEDINILDHGMAFAAESMLPPAVGGYDASYRSSVHFDPAFARRLLDHFGYKKRGNDRCRSLPNGQPLILQMHSLASTTGRLRDEFWRRSLETIGINVVFKSDRFGEIIKASRLGKVQMFETNWIADFPDGDNFFQLLYSANIGRANYARFRLPEYGNLFEQAQALTDSPARTALYQRMSRLVEGYAPWVLRTHPLEISLVHPWLQYYKRHPVENTTWRYLDIDTSLQSKAR
jgi:ABC-type transport system substrate-binding protein